MLRGADLRGIGYICHLKSFQLQAKASLPIFYTTRSVATAASSNLLKAINKGNIYQAQQAYDSLLSSKQTTIDRESIRKLLLLVRRGKRYNDLDFMNRVLRDMRHTWQISPSHFEYHALMYAYGLQRLPEKAHYVLEQMKSEANLSPTLYSYNTLLGCYKRVNDMKQAEQLWKEMINANIRPDRVTYNTMIHLFQQSERYDRAFDMYYTMVKNGVQADMYTFSTLLDAAVKSGNQQVGKEIYDTILTKCKPNDVDINVFNNMVRYSAVLGLDQALDLYYDLPQNYPHIQADRVTFNIMLDICLKNNNPSRAYMIFGDMRRAGMSPDVITYGTLIDAESKLGNLKESLQLFEDMCDALIRPNERVFNSLVNIASSKSASTKDLDKLLDIVKTYGQKLRLDAKAYNSLMHGLALSGRSEQAQHIYDTVFRNAYYQPDIATFTHLILAYINDNKVDDAMEIYYTLREHHKKCKDDSIKSNIKIPIQLDTTFYSALIAALSKQNTSVIDEADELSARLSAAMTIFEDMRPLQIQPTTHTYTAMLHACGQYRDQYVLDQIHKLIKVDLYLDPDIGIYNALMDAYNRTGDGETVLDIWQTLSSPAMQTSHLAPDHITVSIVFDSCGHNGYIQRAQSIWEWLKQTRFKLNTNNYNSYIECLCRSRGRAGWDQAFQIADQEMSSPLKPLHGKPLMDEKTVNTLISFAKKKGFGNNELKQLEQWKSSVIGSC